MPNRPTLPNCALCQQLGQQRQAVEIDHILPRRLSGGDEPFNLWPLCRECHLEKTSEYDNTHLQIAYSVRPELWEIRRNRRQRAEDYESHKERECDPDCPFCTGDFRGEKDEDDRRAEEISAELSYETFLIGSGNLVLPERWAVPLVYALYGPEPEVWRAHLLKWLWFDMQWTDDSRSGTRLRRFMRSHWVASLARNLDKASVALDALLHSAQGGRPVPDLDQFDRGLRGALSTVVDLETGRLHDEAASKVEEGRRFYARENVSQQSFLDMVPVRRARH